MSDERALTTKQPWASLIMAGVKDVENRSWPVPSTLPPFCVTNHSQPISRGDDFTDDPQPCKCGPFPFLLWIHAGKTVDRRAVFALAHRLDAPSVLAPWLDHVTTIPSRREEFDVTCAEFLGALLGSVLVTGCHHADECPGWCSPWAEPDAWHWTLADPQPLPEPIPMKGRQGLWRLPDDMAVPA